MTTSSSDPALVVGLEEPDDAAVYVVADGVALVQTVDFFTPVVDDPFDWGWIAAVNALSDIYAMGAKPRTAMNLVGWPRALGFELLGKVLEGGEAACAEAGVAVVGGHSVDDPEPKFGLSVSGIVSPDRIVRKSTGRAGDALILTKPLGTGIISSAIKDQKAPDEAVDAAVASMKRSNGRAAEVMVAAGASAGTDVTGFGFVGHLRQMLTSLDAEIDAAAIPLLPRVLDLVADGVWPGGSQRNLDAARGYVSAPAVDPLVVEVLHDAQTSGGLLFAVAQGSAAEVVDALHQAGVTDAAVVGQLKEGSGRIEIG